MMNQKENFNKFLTKLQEFIDDTKKQGYDNVQVEDLKENMEKIFSVFDKSEDEKIKHQIEVILANTDLSKFALDYTFSDMLDWLNRKDQDVDDDTEDFTVYYPLKNGKGEYESIPYSFYGALTSYSNDKDLVEFLRKCFYTKEECNEWIENHNKEKKITHEEICKAYGIPDIGEFSDGYHTFNGLYRQRMILFAVLVKTYKDKAWKSWYHEDGSECFGGGWFIVGIDTPSGSYTYHYEAKDWDKFDCQVLRRGKHWDGHDEKDVERLFSLVKESTKHKFKVYDWLINEHRFIIQIIAIENGLYKYRYNDRILECSWEQAEQNCHLWAINDAKDGDILVDSNHRPFIFKGCLDHFHPNCPVAYCGIDSDDCFLADELQVAWWTDENVYPATKEECDLLFNKMKEAGYDWDAYKKELKKIEQKLG